MTVEARALPALRAQGLVGDRGNIRCPCPAHGRGRGDQNPSLSVTVKGDGRVLMHCFGGCTIEDVLAALGLEKSDLYPLSTPEQGNWRPIVRRSRSSTVAMRSTNSSSTSPNRPAARDSKPSFRPDEAEATWEAALARAFDDEAVVSDMGAYEFLARRGLMEAWELRLVGVIADGMDLHSAIRRWPRSGHVVLVPLHDRETGEIANVKSRSIWARPRNKTLVPERSPVSGTVFACAAGEQILRGRSNESRVVLGEGLTDFLALAIHSPVPVLCVPGSSVLKKSPGTWVKGRDVYVAVDCDAAGEKEVAACADACWTNGARNVFRVVWPGHANDACDALAALGPNGFAEFLERWTSGEVRGEWHPAA